MNLNNLGKAQRLNGQLSHVRAERARAERLPLGLMAGREYVTVEDDTRKAITTLVLADLEKREKTLVEQLEAIGITVSAPDKAQDGATKSENGCCASPEISIEIVEGGKISPDTLLRMFGGVPLQGGIGLRAS